MVDGSSLGTVQTPAALRDGAGLCRRGNPPFRRPGAVRPDHPADPARAARVGLPLRRRRNRRRGRAVDPADATLYGVGDDRAARCDLPGERLHGDLDGRRRGNRRWRPVAVGSLGAAPTTGRVDPVGLLV